VHLENPISLPTRLDSMFCASMRQPPWHAQQLKNPPLISSLQQSARVQFRALLALQYIRVQPSLVQAYALVLQEPHAAVENVVAREVRP
jgi:hypothetical protein